jgi:hypothetical protein
VQNKIKKKERENRKKVPYHPTTTTTATKQNNKSFSQSLFPKLFKNIILNSNFSF